MQPPSLENSRPYYPVRQQYVGFLKPRCIQLVPTVYTLQSALLKSSERAVSSYYFSLFCLCTCMQIRVKVKKGMNQDVCHAKGHWNNAWTCSLQGTPLASESDKGKGAAFLQFFNPRIGARDKDAASSPASLHPLPLSTLASQACSSERRSHGCPTELAQRRRNRAFRRPSTSASGSGKRATDKRATQSRMAEPPPLFAPYKKSRPDRDRRY